MNYSPNFINRHERFLEQKRLTLQLRTEHCEQTSNFPNRLPKRLDGHSHITHGAVQQDSTDICPKTQWNVGGSFCTDFAAAHNLHMMCDRRFIFPSHIGMLIDFFQLDHIFFNLITFSSCSHHISHRMTGSPQFIALSSSFQWLMQTLGCHCKPITSWALPIPFEIVIGSSLLCFHQSSGKPKQVLLPCHHKLWLESSLSLSELSLIHVWMARSSFHLLSGQWVIQSYKLYQDAMWKWLIEVLVKFQSSFQQDLDAAKCSDSHHQACWAWCDWVLSMAENGCSMLVCWTRVQTLQFQLEVSWGGWAQIPGKMTCAQNLFSALQSVWQC